MASVNDVVSRPGGDFRNIVLTAVAVGVTAILSVTFIALVARTVGPAAYAEFSAAVAVAALVSLALSGAATTATHLAAVYAAAGATARIRGLSELILRRLVLYGLIGALVWAVIAPWLGSWMRFTSPSLAVAAYIVAFGSLGLTIQRGIVRGKQEFGVYGVSLVAEATLRLIAGAALLALLNVPVAAVIAYAVASFIVGGWLAMRTRSAAPAAAPVSPSDFGRLLGPTTVLVLSMAVFQNIDVLIAKRFFASVDAGTYAAAATLARWTALVAMPVDILLLPRVTFLLQRRAAIRRAVLQLAGAALAMVLVPLTAFAMVPDQLMRWIYGPEFVKASALLLPVGAAFFMAHISYSVTQALLAAGRRLSLYLFACVAMIEVCVLIFWHPTLYSVALTMVIARATVLIGTLATAFATRSAPHPEHPTNRQDILR